MARDLNKDKSFASKLKQYFRQVSTYCWGELNDCGTCSCASCAVLLHVTSFPDNLAFRQSHLQSLKAILCLASSIRTCRKSGQSVLTIRWCQSASTSMASSRDVEILRNWELHQAGYVCSSLQSNNRKMSPIRAIFWKTRWAGARTSHLFAPVPSSQLRETHSQIESYDRCSLYMFANWKGTDFALDRSHGNKNLFFYMISSGGTVWICSLDIQFDKQAIGWVVLFVLIVGNQFDLDLMTEG